jgi:hypothetical protein
VTSGSGELPDPELVYGVLWRPELVAGRVRWVAEENGTRWSVSFRDGAWTVFRERSPMALSVAGVPAHAVRAALVAGSTYIAAARPRHP